MQLPLTHSVAAIQYQECLSGRRQVSNDRSLQLKVKVHFCRNEEVHFVEMSKLFFLEKNLSYQPENFVVGSFSQKDLARITIICEQGNTLISWQISDPP